jgi:hypothetical protein
MSDFSTAQVDTGTKIIVPDLQLHTALLNSLQPYHTWPQSFPESEIGSSTVLQMPPPRLRFPCGMVDLNIMLRILKRGNLLLTFLTQNH